MIGHREDVQFPDFFDEPRIRWMVTFYHRSATAFSALIFIFTLQPTQCCLTCAPGSLGPDPHFAPLSLPLFSQLA